MCAFANNLDLLENHIEKYGSVVAKQPDVWGQARLTKHREEFEKVMEQEKCLFDDTLQGSLSRSDQAYFADAFALSAAISGQSAGVTPPGPVAVATTQGHNTTTPKPLSPQELPDQSDTFGAFSNISRNGVTTGVQLGFAAGKNGIQIEPIIHLDQKGNFLNHLHELRRINEGDDTADSPGYSLNLVRIPVSVLPGKCTEQGHGAEVTMSLQPYLSNELLPTTFRNLVLNDVVDQIGFPVTHFINNPDNAIYLDDRIGADLHELLNYVDSTSFDALWDHPNKLKALRLQLSLQPLFSRPEWLWVDEFLRRRADMPSVAKPTGDLNKLTPDEKDIEAKNRKTYEDNVNKIKGAIKAQIQNRVQAFHPGFPVPATKSRRARLPFPAAQLTDIYGEDFAFHMAIGAYRALAKEPFIKPCPDSKQIYVHLPDIHGYLQEESTAAYKFLADPSNIDLWVYCTPQLATDVRNHNLENIQSVRDGFKNAVDIKMASERGRHTVMAALAWAILVESALLTEQLVLDMKESAAAKGCGCINQSSLDYYMPCPSAEARTAFNEYVRCRWPIHVFALDPVANQQNIADVFSGRREMQLALSLAFVSGQISARNMTRYARRIEYDFATIDINGTAVGFSHGDETFGWRFYPRFQTPEIQSNATVFARDLLIGGPSRNAFLRQRRLEPGMRECVAIVIMPSFVPYATLTTSSSWFRLTNPKCKEMDSVDAVKLSGWVKSIQNQSMQICNADQYRDGDLERLTQKAKQLEARLPLQSTMVQVPYENTLGGFAMFNTGVTDLTPELTGWYGAASINPKNPTTVFLVGNHFSVHQTKVIAGGREVPGADREMLSRQVIKVTIPPCTILVGDENQKFVDVHVATPYGVTSHMLIPVCSSYSDCTPPVNSQANQPYCPLPGQNCSGMGMNMDSGLPAAPKPPVMTNKPPDMNPATMAPTSPMSDGMTDSMPMGAGTTPTHTTTKGGGKSPMSPKDSGTPPAKKMPNPMPAPEPKPKTEPE
jgi:hypothetical protein